MKSGLRRRPGVAVGEINASSGDPKNMSSKRVKKLGGQATPKPSPSGTARGGTKTGEDRERLLAQRILTSMAPFMATADAGTAKINAAANTVRPAEAASAAGPASPDGAAEPSLSENGAAADADDCQHTNLNNAPPSGGDAAGNIPDAADGASTSSQQETGEAAAASGFEEGTVPDNTDNVAGSAAEAASKVDEVEGDTGAADKKEAAVIGAESEIQDTDQADAPTETEGTTTDTNDTVPLQAETMVDADRPELVTEGLTPESQNGGEKSPSAQTAVTTRCGPVNGELLSIDSLQALSPEDRQIVHQSDEAYTRVRQTWESWKQVRAGLVVLRNLAMRETGANDIKSKLYKNYFHELLEQRAYRSGTMDATTRKALLKCEELAPTIDEWHDKLVEDCRLRLNHPVAVLRAFRESQNDRAPPPESRRVRHQAEIEKVREEAATAISKREVQIDDQRQQIDRLLAQGGSADVNVETSGDSVVQYVIARCRGEEIKIRQVIEALTAHLERREQ